MKNNLVTEKYSFTVAIDADAITTSSFDKKASETTIYKNTEHYFTSKKFISL